VVILYQVRVLLTRRERGKEHGLVSTAGGLFILTDF